MSYAICTSIISGIPEPLLRLQNTSVTTGGFIPLNFNYFLVVNDLSVFKKQTKPILRSHRYHESRHQVRTVLNIELFVFIQSYCFHRVLGLQDRKSVV